MAKKKLREEYIKLNIDINGNKAQKEIYDLEKSTRDLKERQKELRVELRHARSQYGRNSDQVEKLTNEFKRNEATIKSNTAQVKQLEGGLKATEMTTNQLSRRARELRSALANMVAGGEARKKLEAELAQVNLQLGKMNTRVAQQRLTLSGAANWLNKYQTMLGGVVVAITGVVFGLQQWLQYSAKLSDQQADVRKTTGMTREEVEELTRSLSELDTRTSRIDLLKLAEGGGRIGIAKDEMLEFVDAMDKANVALGDVFGSPEEIADMLGKIRALYSETREMGVGEAFTAIGSGLNEIAAQGAASEKNIAEFMQRVGAMPDILRPAIGDALGLAAAMEENNIKAEVGSRAYSIFLRQATNNLPAFAEVMGTTVDEAQKLFDMDPLQFFLQFSKSLNDSGKSASEMSIAMNELGLNADGVIKIVGSAGSNFNRYQKLIRLSNDAMEEGTSLLDEYNVKNENLAAMLEKIGRYLRGVFSSKTIMNGLESMVETFGRLVGVLDENDESVQRWRRNVFFAAKVLAVLTAGVLSYRAGVALATLWQNRNTAALNLNTLAKKANALSGGTLRVVQIALITLYHRTTAAITGSTAATQRYRAAQILLNRAIAVNPLGAFLTVLTLVAGALWLYSSRLRDAANQHKNLNTEQQVAVEHQKELSKSTNELKSRIDPLIRVLRDETTSLETRKRAYRALIDIAPDFIDTVDDEYRATLRLSSAYDELIRKLDAAALARARESVRQRKAQDLANAEAEEYEAKLKADAEKERNDELRDRLFDRVATQSRYGTNEQLGGSDLYRVNRLSDAEQKAYEEAKKKTVEARKAMNDFSDYQAETIRQLEAKIKTRLESGIASAKEIEELQAELNAMLGISTSSEESRIMSDDPIETETTEASTKASNTRDRELDTILAETKRFHDEILRLKREREDMELSILDDSYDKEKAKIELEHARRIEDLKKQITSEQELAAWQMARDSAERGGNSQLAAAIDEKIKLAKDKNIELNNQLATLEVTHQMRMNTLAIEFGNRNFQEREKQFEREKQQAQTEFNNLLAGYESYEQIKLDLQDKLSKEELEKIKDWDSAKAALQKIHQEEQLQRELEYVNEVMDEVEAALEAGEFNGVNLDAMTPEQKQAMLDFLDLLRAKAAELGAELKGIQLGGGTDDKTIQVMGNVDLFGLGAEDWLKMFNNMDTTQGKLLAIRAGFNALSQSMSYFYEQQDQKARRSMQVFEQTQTQRRNALQLQLDQGLISQSKYDEEVKKMELAMERRKAEAEYEQAKRQKQQALMNVAMQTAQALIGLWASPGFPAAIPLMGVVTALGAVQAGIIGAQKIPKPVVPGYEDGYGYQDVIRSQDGKPFRAKFRGRAKSGIVDEPSLFLAGEHMPEMIIDGNSFKQFSPYVKDAIHAELRRVNGYAGGYYPQENMSSGVPTDANAGYFQALIALLETQNILLSEIRDKEIVFPRTLQVADALKKDMKELEKLKQSAKL